MFSIFLPCQGLGLSMPHICDLVFIFNLVFIAINNVQLFKQVHMFFVHPLEYLLLFLDGIFDGECE